MILPLLPLMCEHARGEALLRLPSFRYQASDGVLGQGRSISR